MLTFVCQQEDREPAVPSASTCWNDVDVVLDIVLDVGLNVRMNPTLDRERPLQRYVRPLENGNLIYDNVNERIHPPSPWVVPCAYV